MSQFSSAHTMKYLKIILLLTNLVHEAFATFNNCEISLDFKNVSLDWGTKCPSNAKLAKIEQNFIVNYHNKYRSLIARGRIDGFPPAARMATMEWNPELAFLSHFYIRNCSLEKVNCRKTKSFQYVGENIGLLSSTASVFNRQTSQTLISSILDNWWEEHKVATRNDIRKYPRYPSSHFGHFTLMVNELNNAIGCAAVRYTIEEKSFFLMACHYATTNLIGWPVYIEGAPASICRAFGTRKYPGLCPDSEVYAELYK